MVIARLAASIVEAKCHGASRCVVLWVESRIHSIAQPSRSGKSSRAARKELDQSAAVCQWAKLVDFRPIAWRIGPTSFSSGHRNIDQLARHEQHSLCFLCFNFCRHRSAGVAASDRQQQMRARTSSCRGLLGCAIQDHDPIDTRNTPTSCRASSQVRRQGARGGGRYQIMEDRPSFTASWVIESDLRAGVACFHLTEYDRAAAFRRNGAGRRSRLVIVESGDPTR